MLVACWSAKGGAGTTVVAAGLALVGAKVTGAEVLLVDLAGDLPAVLGLAGEPERGVADWLAAGTEVPADGLARLEVDVAPGVRLLPRGVGALTDAARGAVLAGALGADGRLVIADCGRADASREDATMALASAAVRSLLVTRPCYVALRRAVRAPFTPSGVVCVLEPGRALDPEDVAEVVGSPILAEVPLEPAIARAVDAGLLAARLPRSLERALRPLL